MRFADERKSSWVWGVTLILALLLVGVFLRTRDAEMPLLLSIASQREPSAKTDCLTSPAARRLLGKTEQVPIGNPLFDRWVSRNNSLHLTSQGHRIIIHFVSRPTLVRVYGRDGLSGAQADLFRTCTDATAMW